MEDITRLILIGALGWMAIEWFLRIIKRNQYKKILEALNDGLESKEYKNSIAYYNRLSYIREVGFKKALTEHINEINYGICKKFKINDNILRDTSIKEAQNIHMMIYAIAHGQGDEMKRILELGSQIEKIISNKGKDGNYI